MAGRAGEYIAVKYSLQTRKIAGSIIAIDHMESPSYMSKLPNPRQQVKVKFS
jgi:hypothetical protein